VCGQQDCHPAIRVDGQEKLSYARFSYDIQADGRLIQVDQLWIVEQRSRAQTALGAKYDLRDFNQAVVDGGNVPLDVLAANVTRYVDAAKGA